MVNLADRETNKKMIQVINVSRSVIITVHLICKSEQCTGINFNIFKTHLL